MSQIEVNLDELEAVDSPEKESEQKSVDKYEKNDPVNIAKAADIEADIKLKRGLSIAITIFMGVWTGIIFYLINKYFNYQICLRKEIPKEVIASILASTSIVVGLVGYMLKGLFRSLYMILPKPFSV